MTVSIGYGKKRERFLLSLKRLGVCNHVVKPITVMKSHKAFM